MNSAERGSVLEDSSGQHRWTLHLLSDPSANLLGEWVCKEFLSHLEKEFSIALPSVRKRELIPTKSLLENLQDDLANSEAPSTLSPELSHTSNDFNKNMEILNINSVENRAPPKTASRTDLIELHLFIIAIWDGASHKTVEEIDQVKSWVNALRKNAFSSTSESKSSNTSTTRSPYDHEHSSYGQHRIVVQFLNAKKGNHSYYINKDNTSNGLNSSVQNNASTFSIVEVKSNIMRAIEKKLSSLFRSKEIPLDEKSVEETESTLDESRSSASTDIVHTAKTSSAVASSLSTSNPVSTHDTQILVNKPSFLQTQLQEGQGEVLLSLSEENTTKSIKTQLEELEEAARRCGAKVQILVDSPERSTMDVLVRSISDYPCIEMRFAVCGNVDSGKSTLTSVLTRQQMDDGRGLARSKVFKHRHEAESGRTSSISEQYLGFDENGSAVNYYSHVLTKEETKGLSRKVITFFDLAGHERYLKTTVLGMTRSLPDYALLVISANNGIQRMTKEHLALCLALKIPFMVIITRIDSTPQNVRQDTLRTILRTLRHSTVRKVPFHIQSLSDVTISARSLKLDRLVPILEVSNVTGDRLPLLYALLNLLPPRYPWLSARDLPTPELVVDNTFHVPGVGTVVAGIVTQGTFRVSDAVALGPDGSGHFRATQIKSIHSKRMDVARVCAGCDACFALKREKRSQVRKGMVVLGGEGSREVLAKGGVAYWSFDADVTILYHSTTISTNYEPVIHSSTVRQAARIQLDAGEVLRTGDKANVRFVFLYRPEFMKLGQKLVFREGRTKGLGIVTGLHTGRPTPTRKGT